MIRILVVDDHGILRAGVDLIIEQTDDMKVVGQAADGREGVDLAHKLKPDVVLMDISMPGLNGIDASREILNENSGVKILALSAHCNRRFIKDALRAGIAGYALKDGMADELVEAIRVVNAGEQYLSSKVAKVVVEDYIHSSESMCEKSPLDKLTIREREVLQLFAENKTTKQIAKLLHVSPKTVEADRRKLMNKLGISGIADLTKLAIREGLTSLEP